MESDLSTIGPQLNVALIGASGGLGSAFLDLLSADPNVDTIYVLTRRDITVTHDKIITHHLNYNDEATIARAAGLIDAPLHIILIATGFLHDESTQPEKALRDLSIDGFHKNFMINCIGPALVAKHFVPKLPRHNPSVFAAISARVGSIADNKIGGWYAYRASKAALNMVIKTTAIEVARRYDNTCVIGLHPGTVATALSSPFSEKVKHTVFTPQQSASYLLRVISQATAADSGKILAWDGHEISP